MVNQNIRVYFQEQEKSKFKILEIESVLDGRKRFVSEGLITKTQCKNLIGILKTFSIIGDGYNTTSPHSKMEKFEGISLERIILLVYFGLLNQKHLKMILDITEDARDKVTDYFDLKQHLYFTYTHLVCRSSLNDFSTNRTDLSHEIHADNCNIYPDGKCEKLAPSYTWRDYSAIIYLNDDFEGGDFFFTSDIHSKSIQKIVTPACGKMVAFSSGSENLHGVKAVRKGSRCALALWFTFQEKYAEKERNLAYNLLSREEF